MDSITVSEGKRPAPGTVEDEEQQQQQRRQQHQHRRGESSEKTGDLPQPKRRRVADNARVRSAKACQRCRRLKEKCDGQQPCQRCMRSGRDCEFAPASVSGPTGVPIKLEPASSARTRQSLAPGLASVASAAGEGGSAADADSTRSEERTKCLERLVQHLLGDVPMDLNNLRRMAEKASQRTGPGSDVGSAKTGTEDLDDLTLEDENFTVKTLSQSTAREFSFFVSTA